MANPEHLEILKQGVKVWNEWRASERNRRKKELKPDLTNANLDCADLRGINFYFTDLRYANLRAANLIESNLAVAELDNADLTNADLNSADLTYASFKGASLTGADLNFAILIEANLSHANLSGTSMGFTRFGDNDLSLVKGLDNVHHNFPSTVDINSIFLSRGNIPEVFLRGCGMPESFITHIPSLIASVNPIQFYSCFISYSSKDQNFADRLYAGLQNKGVRCWFAPEDLKIGDKIRDVIDVSIRLRDKLLLVLSEHSIASQWVEHEVESAIEEERQRGRTILFPIRLDDAVMESSKAWAALIRSNRHIGDFTRWKDHDSYQKAFDRLLRDLKAEEKKV